MKKCGCTWLLPCKGHNAEMEKIDREIDERFLSRANRHIEDNLSNVEDSVGGILGDFVLLLAACGFIFWVCIG